MAVKEIEEVKERRLPFGRLRPDLEPPRRRGRLRRDSASQGEEQYETGRGCVGLSSPAPKLVKWDTRGPCGDRVCKRCRRDLRCDLEYSLEGVDRPRRNEFGAEDGVELGRRQAIAAQPGHAQEVRPHR